MLGLVRARWAARWLGIAGALLALLPAPAGAEEPASDSEAAARDVEAPGRQARQHRLSWTFPRFRWWQYVSSAAVSGSNLYIESSLSPYPESRWKGGVLFDDQLREWLRAETPDGRLRAHRVSEYLWQPVQYYTVLVDSLFVPLVLDRGNVDVAWQMSMLNWQVIGLAFFVTRLSHLTVGRARPSLEGCNDDLGSTNRCGPRGPSFFSGHTSMGAAGAGLACAHHQALPLYGARWAGTVTCVALIGAVLTNGTLRIVADKHWASDVLVGAFVGGALGYGLPWLLHYGQHTASGSPRGSPRPLGAGLLPENLMLVPLASSTHLGLAVTGAL